MNDPFVADQAKKWATRVLAEPGLDDHARVARMVEAATGREPDKATLDNPRRLPRRTINPLRCTGREVWSDLAHALLIRRILSVR